ncbi:MAG: mechanosensitive ion channel [Flaviflexus sp.]|nr:mechanosensitive ion channel [Flaviflexus sp.]
MRFVTDSIWSGYAPRIKVFRLVTMNLFSLRSLQVSDDDTGISDQVDQAVDTTINATVDVISLAVGIAVGAGIGLVIAVVIQSVAKQIGRRRPIIAPALRPMFRPMQALFAVIGAWIGFMGATVPEAGADEPAWRHIAFHGFLILTILVATWFIASIVQGFEDAVVAHVRQAGTKRARRIQTQFQIVRRVAVLVIWVLGIAGVLITFPSARAAGASILASAGIVSVIAGLAAQTTLGNLFAGLQVAFSDSLRVDDIVIINDEFCVVEEITLTYVVVRVWDGRRIIVPSNKLTGETFENWTRREPDLLGNVHFDLDWMVPIDAMRSEFLRFIRQSDLWDGRTAVLQVRDAEGGLIKVSVLVSAKDSSALIDLQYQIREHIVKWIQEKVPSAVPYRRNVVIDLEEREAVMGAYPNPQDFVDVEDADPRPPVRRGPITAETQVMSVAELRAQAAAFAEESGAAPGHESSIFTGSAEAEARARDFAGPGEDAFAERERRAQARTTAEQEAIDAAVDDDEETRRG